MTPLVVFDCLLFLQGAACSEGPAAACLRLAETGHVDLCLSSDVLAEVRDVLARSKLRRKFPALTDETVTAFLTRVSRFARLVPDVPRAAPLPRDHKDEKFLDLAVATGATYLVSRDHDLLDLMDDQTPEGRVFRTNFPQIIILDPVSFLRTIAGQSAS